MPHLSEALTWTIDQPGRIRNYVFHHDGHVLGNATRILTERPDDLGLPYPDPHVLYDESRVVVRLADAAGAPCCLVDRTSATMSVPPAFILAPNGSDLIGRVYMKGESYRLLDANGDTVANLGSAAAWGAEAEVPVAGRGGAEIARYRTEKAANGEARRRHTVRLARPLPEPDHTLLLASLIGVELHIPAS